MGVIHYVHNPVRASLVKLEEGIESYSWGNLEDYMKPKRSRERRKGYSAEQIRDHGVTTAERVIKAAETVFVLDVEDWGDLPKGDWRKGLVAGLIRAVPWSPMDG